MKTSLHCRTFNFQLNSLDSSIICQLPTPELWIQFSAANANNLVSISSQSPSSADSRDSFNYSRYIASGRPQQETPFPRNSSTVIKVCLSRRCREKAVLLLLSACMLRTLRNNSRCLQSHCLATDLYATIFSSALHIWRWPPPSAVLECGMRW
jgi:hypothetical protein